MRGLSSPHKPHRTAEPTFSEKKHRGRSETEGLWKTRRKKCAYWMRPSMVEEMESMLSQANATSKSEFVCQAVEFYIAYLRQNKSLEFLSPLLAQTIKTEVESVERHISEMLFKVAVEQSIQNNLTAAFNEVDEDTMARLRNSCAGEVARLNGVVSFEDAYEWQRGE